jgi:2-polyprenyl-6-methoxyphenol hydroxylase-like FAD-dependent oxidoreductase
VLEWADINARDNWAGPKLLNRNEAHLLKAIIIGAGIGGLAAAISLRQAGLEVAVFERVADLKPLGAGLSIWPNAVKAFDRLGVGTAFRQAAEPNGGNIFAANGTRLSHLPATLMADQFGTPLLGIHRADLHALLLDALDPGVVQLGADCVGFAQEAAGVQALFADGTVVEGDVLIGADGIKSVIRTQLYPTSQPIYAGYTAWRGITTPGYRPDSTAEGFEGWGCGQRFGMIYLNDGRAYWFATDNRPEGEAEPPGGAKAALLSLFQGWSIPVQSIIEATDEADILHHDIYDLDSLPRWTRDRVALLGDAAHAMTPNLGQGACQAVEDAVALGQVFSQAKDPLAGLAEYETRRYERATFIQRRSRQIGRIGQFSNSLLCGLRDTAMHWTPMKATLKQLIPIIGYEP